MAQDLPPTGGYEPIQYKRNIPTRGFRPSYYLVAVGAICIYGLYKTGQGIREQKYGSYPVNGHSLRPVITQISGADLIFLAHPDWVTGVIGLIVCCCSELAREKMWSRIHLIPMLQAEEDRDLVRRKWADQARERQLMGGETKVYHTDRFIRPTFSITPSKVSK